MKLSNKCRWYVKDNVAVTRRNYASFKVQRLKRTLDSRGLKNYVYSRTRSRSGKRRGRIRFSLPRARRTHIHVHLEVLDEASFAESIMMNVYKRDISLVRFVESILYYNTLRRNRYRKNRAIRHARSHSTFITELVQFRLVNNKQRLFKLFAFFWLLANINICILFICYPFIENITSYITYVIPSHYLCSSGFEAVTSFFSFVYLIDMPLATCYHAAFISFSIYALIANLPYRIFWQCWCVFFNVRRSALFSCQRGRYEIAYLSVLLVFICFLCYVYYYNSHFASFFESIFINKTFEYSDFYSNSVSYNEFNIRTFSNSWSQSSSLYQNSLKDIESIHAAETLFLNALKQCNYEITEDIEKRMAFSQLFVDVVYIYRFIILFIVFFLPWYILLFFFFCFVISKWVLWNRRSYLFNAFKIYTSVWIYALYWFHAIIDSLIIHIVHLEYLSDFCEHSGPVKYGMVEIFVLLFIVILTCTHIFTWHIVCYYNFLNIYRYRDRYKKVINRGRIRMSFILNLPLIDHISVFFSFITIEYIMLFFIFFLLIYGTFKYISTEYVLLPKMHVFSILIVISTFLLCVLLISGNPIQLHLSALDTSYTGRYYYNLIVECFILLIGFTVFFFTYSFNKFLGIFSFEYYIIMLFCLCSFCLFVHANNLVFMYVLIELQSIASYVLTSMNKHNRYSIEAGLKYFILGSFSSIFLLFGFSFVYGFSGFIYLSDLTSYVRYLYSIDDDFFLYCILFSFIFVNIGFLFKIYSAPFHFWVSDIYQGSPTSVTMFLSTIPVLSYVYLFIKLYVFIFSDFFFFYNYLLYVISVLSMLSGVFGALIQRRIKKLIAYSSVSTVGYILASLSGDNVLMIQQCILYLFVYILNILPIFIVILNYRINNNSCIDNIRSFSSLYSQNKYIFFIMFTFFLSLAGVPPFSGFASKLSLFTALGSEGLFILLFFCILTAIISCYYYLRVAKMIFYDYRSTFFFFSNITYSAAFSASYFFLFNCFFLFFSSVLEDISMYISICLYLHN